MKLTKKKAKKLSLEKWYYLRDHPDIKSVVNMDNYIFKKLQKYAGCCPLCELHLPLDDNRPVCEGCILYKKTRKAWGWDCGYYNKWVRTRTEKTRAEAAQVIIDIIEAWEV